MKKGETYAYNKIYKYAEENDYEMIEYGVGLIGEDFIVLNSGVQAMSFVSTGYNSMAGFMYECVYSDME